MTRNRLMTLNRQIVRNRQIVPNSRRLRPARVAMAVAAAVLAAGLAACSGSSSSSTPGATAASPSSTAAAVAGGTAKVALPAGSAPSYILPYMPVTNASQYNTIEFQWLLYRPLYMFGNNGQSVDVNYPLSVANAPAFTDGGKTVTITMKGWKWSDGEAVDASDVVFWLNMMKAEPANFYGYVPGLLPDNLASYSVTGPDTVVLHLKSATSSTWFTYNQLAEITPMPAAWDVTSAKAAPGSGGCATSVAKCAAVYNFLSGQAKNTATYASNPLWGVVDGAWKLSAFSTAASGPVTSFVPNQAYSGSPKPQLAGVTYYAYTDEAAEYTALRTGQLDIGYISDANLPEVAGNQVLPSSDPLGSGYTLAANYTYSLNYFYINYNNPTLGAAFKQLYVRQALQELVNQAGMVKAVQRGYGYPTAGAVPIRPGNQWTPPVENENAGQGPYPFSVASATKLLTSHGWKQVGGVDTCEAPGTSPAECGAGVAAGSTLSITMAYATGTGFVQQEVSIMKSDYAQGGVKLTLVPESFNTIIGELAPCKPAQASCHWQALNLGEGWNFNGPGFLPTGEPLFATGAATNAGSYSNPTEDSLITATHTSDSPSVFRQYATYTAEQLPLIWTPNFYTVQAVGGGLTGVHFNPLDTLLPEYWHFTR
jgi:peptide/nickel transport system substrate-binding protein